MGLVEISDAVQIYREYAKYPSISSAQILVGSNDNFVKVYSQWTQRDLERFEKTKYSRTDLIQKCTRGKYEPLGTSVPSEITNELWNKESPSGNLRAIVRKVTNKKGDEQFYVEIWNKTRKEKTIDLQVSDKHGKVYESDGQFGCLEWSASEGHLLYVAEKKLPKTVSYFDAKAAQQDENNKKPGEEVIKGDEAVFREDWGELLAGKHHPVLCVLDTETGDVSVLENVPDDISPGQAVWCPDDSGVVFVGWSHEPWRLGLIYCTQRNCALYHIDLQSASCSVIGCIDQSVRSPVFSPDQSKLVYLQNPAGGPHQRCSQLVVCEWKTKCSSVIVDIVHNLATLSEFPGLYLQNLPTHCWANDSKRLVLHSSWRSKQEVLLINTGTKSVTRLTNDAKIGTWMLLDVNNDILLATCSSPNQCQKLMFGKLPAEGQEQSIVWHPVDNEDTTLSEISWRILQHKVPADGINKDYAELDYESILLLPNLCGAPDKPPLVLYPHGGPHTVFPADFIIFMSTLCRCGFAVLMVNYRGSTGFGQASIDSLPGNVGTQDVNDCLFAAQSVLNDGLADRYRTCVAGGSHGGFLTGHLIGQFPDFFKAAVLRNPVINITTMMGSTDIPDWCLVEAGKSFEHTHIPDQSDYEAAWLHSPIRYAKQVKTPTMLMIGGSDLRVPPKQGQEYYRALKANGTETRMLYYPDNSHPMNKVECESDCFMNIVNWFAQHI